MYCPKARKPECWSQGPWMYKQKKGGRKAGRQAGRQSEEGGVSLIKLITLAFLIDHASLLIYFMLWR